MKKSMLWGLGLLSYLLFSLILTPASVWLKLVPLPAGLQLGPVSGTLWSGQIQGVQQGSWYLPNLQWQLQLSPILRGKLGVLVDGGQLKESELPYVKLQAEVGLGSVAITQSVLRLPMSGVMSQLQLPMPVDASGMLVVNLQQYQSGAPYCQAATGSASWQQARFKTPAGWIDLAAIDATLACADGNLSVQTLDGNPLGLAIKAELLADSYRVSGSLKPDASMPTEVHQAMQFVGQADANGRFPLNLQGQFRLN